jgi:hypothetical protein
MGFLATFVWLKFSHTVIHVDFCYFLVYCIELIHTGPYRLKSFADILKVDE